MQMMGHQNALLFRRFYMNAEIQTDTQSAALETAPSGALIDLVTHMNETRDPYIATQTPTFTRGIVDVDVQRFMKEVDQLRTAITEIKNNTDHIIAICELSIRATTKTSKG